MKNSLIVAATAMLGSASAGVHQMKLQKIPIAEQLEHASIGDQAKALGQKYVCLYLFYIAGAELL